MDPRFVIETREADEDGGLDGYVDPDYTEEVDVLVDKCTGEVVYFDGGEPEDNILCRNLGVLVDLLNKLHEEMYEKEDLA